jgi:hypothetical protein
MEGLRACLSAWPRLHGHDHQGRCNGEHDGETSHTLAHSPRGGNSDELLRGARPPPLPLRSTRRGPHRRSAEVAATHHDDAIQAYLSHDALAARRSSASRARGLPPMSSAHWLAPRRSLTSDPAWRLPAARPRRRDWLSPEAGLCASLRFGYHESWSVRETLVPTTIREEWLRGAAGMTRESSSSAAPNVGARAA